MTAACNTDGQQRAWDWAVMQEQWCLRELARAGQFGLGTATKLVRRWLGMGLIEWVGTEGPGHARNYRQRPAPIPDITASAGGARTAADNMWMAMRKLAVFSPRDIAVQATTSTVVVPRHQAAAYCQLLLKAGYLRVLRKARPPAEAQYRLVRNSGPRPPAERRVRAIHDPNTDSLQILPGEI